jgi:hypothetical protein
MLYVKMLLKHDYSSTAESHRVFCGQRVEFSESLNGPIMNVDGTNWTVTGNCWVMNESGKTISQYVPHFKEVPEGSAPETE